MRRMGGSSARAEGSAQDDTNPGNSTMDGERRYLSRVLEDRAELLGEALELVVGEREQSKVRDMLDISAREPRHGVESKGAPKDRRTDFAYDAPVPKYTFLSDEWFVAAR